MSWLSGQSGRITQCINGNWTPIFDICDYGCPLCRDCGDIAMMGFTQTGVYRVVPSGNYFDPSIQVWCDLNNTLVDGGSGWTTVLRQYANQATFNLPLINYTTPIGNPNLSATAQPTSYFIGKRDQRDQYPKIHKHVKIKQVRWCFKVINLGSLKLISYQLGKLEADKLST
nr:uncharacterized protein LOC128685578 [Cherax quadricarinatus]